MRKVLIIAAMVFLAVSVPASAGTAKKKYPSPALQSQTLNAHINAAQRMTLLRQQAFVRMLRSPVQRNAFAAPKLPQRR